MNQMNFPSSEPNDSDDVTLALETAEALWNRGDPSEALRWLRRAAEAAGDSGDDMRAVVLAKAVAELNASGSESAPKQVKPPPLPPHAAAGDAAAGAAPAGHTNGSEADYPLGLKGSVKGVSKAPPAPPAPPSTRKPVPTKPQAPPSARPQQATSKSLRPPPTPSNKASAKVAASSDDVVSSADPSFGAETTPLPASMRSRMRPSAPAAKHDAGPAKVPEPVNGAAHKRGTPRTFARAALKVYVPANARTGDKLEVYLLHEGERAPAGAVEAMLVPLQRGDKLLE